MPLLNDILDNKVLGREFKRGLKEGLQEGLLEGELKGKLKGELKGELTILRRLIEKRFGAIPGWVEERLAGRLTAEVEELSVRLLDAQSIEDLLK